MCKNSVFCIRDSSDGYSLMFMDAPYLLGIKAGCIYLRFSSRELLPGVGAAANDDDISDPFGNLKSP